MKKPKTKKERVWLYMDKEILKWVYENVETKLYADISHCFERLVMEKIEEAEKHCKKKEGEKNGR
ncbi:MAG: hypothetical protein KKF44_06795 [Nanoarchaeota archaeon]|nr:hypothetical protein [Nanoarchaeota archaeon]